MLGLLTRIARVLGVTAASIAKYLNLKDIQANPAADNVAFTYNGGGNDDTMWVRLDTQFAASRNTIVVGREDFTFTASGSVVNGSVSGNTVNFDLDTQDFHHTGTLSGNSMSGTATWTFDLGAPVGEVTLSGNWSASKTS